MIDFAQALARIEELLKEGNFHGAGLLLDGPDFLMIDRRS